MFSSEFATIFLLKEICIHKSFENPKKAQEEKYTSTHTHTLTQSDRYFLHGYEFNNLHSRNTSLDIDMP